MKVMALMANGGHWEPAQGFCGVYMLCVPMLASEVITR